MGQSRPVFCYADEANKPTRANAPEGAARAAWRSRRTSARRASTRPRTPPATSGRSRRRSPTSHPRSGEERRSPRDRLAVASAQLEVRVLGGNQSAVALEDRLGDRDQLECRPDVTAGLDATARDRVDDVLAA